MKCEAPASSSDWVGGDKSEKKKQKKGKKYEVTVVRKPLGMVNNRSPSGFVFAINGVPCGRVHLKVGHTYCFDVKENPEAGKQHFYFTTDVLGGPRGTWAPSPDYVARKLPGSPDPSALGPVYLKITKDTPRTFYYQSADTPAMGFNVIVHD